MKTTRSTCFKITKTFHPAFTANPGSMTACGTGSNSMTTAVRCARFTWNRSISKAPSKKHSKTFTAHLKAKNPMPVNSCKTPAVCQTSRKNCAGSLILKRTLITWKTAVISILSKTVAKRWCFRLDLFILQPGCSTAGLSFYSQVPPLDQF